jgi:type I restriction enzyme, S subunit
MQAFQDNLIGQIPAGWKPRLIGDDFDIQQGKQLSRKFKSGDNLKGFLRTSNIFWGRIDFSNTDKMQFSQNEMSRLALKKDDLLVCEGGDIGRTAICEEEVSNVFFQNHLHRLRPKRDGYVFPNFFQFWMRYAWTLTDFYVGAGNKTTIPNLSKAKLSRLYYAKPSFSEQKKIAHILSTAQKAVAAQGQVIRTLESLKKSLLQKLFTQGVNGEPVKETEIGLAPKSWDVASLGELCNVGSGGTPSRDVRDFWKGGEIPWVKTGEINYAIINHTSEKITLSGLKNSSTKLFPKGTLLMAMYGQGITRGRVGILGIEAAINQACAAIIPKSDQVTSDYLYRFFECHYQHIRNLGHGANQKNLSATILKGVPIVYPKCKDEQDAICSSLDVLDYKLNVHKKKVNVYRNLFNSLLNDLMTGTLRVHSIKFDDLIQPGKAD